MAPVTESENTTENVDASIGDTNIATYEPESSGTWRIVTVRRLFLTIDTPFGNNPVAVDDTVKVRFNNGFTDRRFWRSLGDDEHRFQMKPSGVICKPGTASPPTCAWLDRKMDENRAMFDNPDGSSMKRCRR